MLAGRCTRITVVSLLALASIGACGSDDDAPAGDTEAGDTGSGDTSPGSSTDSTLSASSTRADDSSSGEPPGTTEDSGSTDDGSSGAETDASTGDATCAPPESLDVLFIGNSYTFTYDLPGLVSMLGTASGIPIYTEAVTEGGQNLQYHLAQPITAETITGHPWDVVVIQGHSLDTVDNLDGFLEAGQALSTMVVDAGAEPLLYETWARKAGHEIYGSNPNAGGSPEAMQAIIRAGYLELAGLTGAAIAPVGDTWEQAEIDHPELDRFGPDFHHPSLHGAYLSACVFYAVLTDVTPVGNVGEPPAGISADEAGALQAVAAAIVQPSCAAP